MTALHKQFDKPVVGISLGDFNGIGPEIIMKVFSDSRLQKICIPVVYGSNKILVKYKKILHFEEEISFHQIRSIAEIHTKKVNVVNCWEEDHEIQPGTATETSGKCAVLALEKAADDLFSGEIDALVTAPLNKKNTYSEKFPFPGHTEFLIKKAGGHECLMMMISDALKVGLVTTHIPLAEVKKNLTKEKLITKINILYKSLKNDFAIAKPKIAVLGINPHAGEEGLLGKEEEEIISPIIEELKTKGLLIFGPFAADGFFGSGQFKKFDAVLAMYHDQGLIPFKTIAFENGVNFTAGLPVIRTSPDHGTAYDIAGKMIADENSLRQAIYSACDLFKAKNEAVKA